jgi:hypothetical protein
LAVRHATLGIQIPGSRHCVQLWVTFPLPPNLEEGSQSKETKLEMATANRPGDRADSEDQLVTTVQILGALPIDSDRLAAADAKAHANYYSKAYRSNQTSSDIGGAVASMAGNTEAQTNTGVSDLNAMYLNLIFGGATAHFRLLFRSQLPKFLLTSSST